MAAVRVVVAAAPIRNDVQGLKECVTTAASWRLSPSTGNLQHVVVFMEEARHSCVGPNRPLLHLRRSLFGSRHLWLIPGAGRILLRLVVPPSAVRRPARGASGRLFLVALF